MATYSTKGNPVLFQTFMNLTRSWQLSNIRPWPA